MWISQDQHDGLDLQLEPYLVAGDVAGVVRSLTGEFQGHLNVSLHPLRSPGQKVPPRSIQIEWKATGASFESSFRFEGVPHGEYKLWVNGSYGLPFELRVNRTQFQAPDEDLEIVVRDDRPRFRLRFVVRSAETQKRLTEVQVRILDASGERLYDGRLSALLKAGFFAAKEPFQWQVHSPGYTSRSGNRADYDALCADPWWPSALILLERK